MKEFLKALLCGCLLGALPALVFTALADEPAIERMPGDTLASAIVTGEPTDEAISIYTTPPANGSDADQLITLEPAFPLTPDRTIKTQPHVSLAFLTLDEDNKIGLGRDLRVAIDAYLDARGCSCRCGSGS